MRKFKLFALAIVCLLLATGCGEKTLTCTNTQSANGLEMGQEVVMKFKKDKVNYVKMTINAKATSDTIKQNWNLFATTLSGQYSDVNKEGVKLTTKNDEKNHTYKISLEVDLDKASEDALAEYDLDGIANKDSSLKDVKKSAEEDGFTCK